MQRLLKHLMRVSEPFRGNRKKDVEYAIRKYRGFRKSGHSVAHDDTYIMIYHTSDLYFMAIEALNNMGRFEPVSVLMNTGVDPLLRSRCSIGRTMARTELQLGICGQHFMRDSAARMPITVFAVILGLVKRDMWQTPERHQKRRL